MTSKLSLIAAAFTAFLAIAAPQAVRADEFSTSQRGEVERIVREYLIAHPEVIQEAMVELEKRQSAADAEKHKAAVKQYSQSLFTSPRQVVLGNPNGNVTFVEFFDYNCGYCKRAMDDMLTLLKDDPKLKVVLKEFPVLGPGRSKPRKSRLPSACRTRPAKNISNSTRSCWAAAAKPIRRARSQPPRRSAWTWHASTRIFQIPR